MNPAASMDLAISVQPASNERIEEIPVACAFYNPQDRALANLRESPKCKFICSVSIISVCIDKNNLPAAPVSRYVTIPPNITTYTYVLANYALYIASCDNHFVCCMQILCRKRYYLKNPMAKPVPFMHPMYISSIIFAYWQAKVCDNYINMQHYEAVADKTLLCNVCSLHGFL